MSAAGPSRLVVFLRGINLGRRRVKMARLREILGELELEGVETFLASGNAVFDAPRGGRSEAELEARIEDHLEDRLGYEVDTFVRSLPSLAELASRSDVAEAEEEGFTPHVIFLREEAPEGTGSALAALEGPDDRFSVLGAEVIWFRRGRMSDGSIGTRELENAVGGAGNTMRNMNTVRRITDRFGD